MKKKALGLFVSVIASMCLIPTVYASEYKSTLSLGQGSYTAGATRPYTEGINKISIKVSSFTKVDGLSYTKLQVDYIEEAINYCFDVGSVTFKVNAKTTYSNDWGRLSNGNRYYKFSTKVGGYSYGGVKSNNVVMTSGTD